jgi:hypothetical protein
LGVRNGSWVEVKAGLRVGEKIVAEGAFLHRRPCPLAVGSGTVRHLPD